MEISIKNTISLKEIQQKHSISPLDAIELIAKADVSIWTHYKKDWVKLKPQDLNHITIKATKAFELIGTFEKADGKSVLIDILSHDLFEYQDDKKRPIETFRIRQIDYARIFVDENKTPEMKDSTVSMKQNQKKIGKHWIEKREAILSAVYYQLEKSLSEGDKSIFKKRNNKPSFNRSYIAQKIVDMSDALPQTEGFAGKLTKERVLDILREAARD